MTHYGGRPCEECGLPMEACNELARRRIEIDRLRAVLKDLFLLARASQDIRADAPQMKAAGKLLAAV
jgi:hypothetical protein